MSKTLRTLKARNFHLKEVKKSRFHAVACRVDSPGEVLGTVSVLKNLEATHNCWASRVSDWYRFADDGEPAGSAGRPILAAIDGQGVDHVLVLVSRFFGGIKLGVGGLIRAYGGAAAECLRTAEKIEIRPTIRIQVRVPFQAVGDLHTITAEYALHRVEEEFEARGLKLVLEIEEAFTEEFFRRIQDVCCGKAELSTPNITTQPDQ